MLGDCSTPHLPHLHTSQAPVGALPRLHALDRMVDMILVNVTRAHDLWPIFLAHVLEV